LECAAKIDHFRISQCGREIKCAEARDDDSFFLVERTPPFRGDIRRATAGARADQDDRRRKVKIFSGIADEDCSHCDFSID
jgi:hypothetical protein